LLRVIGVEKFGFLAFSMAAMSYVAVVSDYGFNLTATREIALNRNKKDVLQNIINSVNLLKIISSDFD
jgi:PST family polysaccharide transporter